MMKRYKLKQSVKKKIKRFIEDFIVSIGIATFLFTGLSFMIYSAKEYDKRMIQEEYNKKTDTSRTYISQ